MKIYTTEAHVVITPVREDGTSRFITVFLNRKKVGVKRNWRCINCGKLLFQYGGSIPFIFDGATEPTETSETDIMCSRCKVVYRII